MFQTESVRAKAVEEQVLIPSEQGNVSNSPVSRYTMINTVLIPSEQGNVSNAILQRILNCTATEVLIPSEQGNVSNRTRRITLFNQQPTRVVHKKVLPNIGTIYA